ncbi:pyocin knob domain-containing protein [Acinetobacter sp. ANC 3781]
MAVPEQTPYKEYVANGTTKKFTLNFICDSQDHLVVTVNDIKPITGAWSLINGEVVFNQPPLVNSVIKIYRNSPLVRNTQFKSYDNSFNATSLNADLDKLWFVLQEFEVKIGGGTSLLQKIIDSLVSGNVNGLPGEVLARISGDNQLKGFIDNEAQRAYLAEINLNERINQEAILTTQKVNSENARAIAAEADLQTQVNSIGVGNKSYTTYALMDAAKATIPANSKVTVTNDPDSAKNGDWQYNGSSFSKSIYDPLQQAKNYVDENPFAKPVRLTTQNIKSLTTVGWHYQVGGSNATPERGYPVLDSGYLLNLGILNSAGDNWAIMIQVYYAASSGNVYIDTYNPTTSLWRGWIKQATSPQLDALKAELKLPKSYEIIFEPSGKNLINENNIKKDFYLNTSGVLREAAGWGTTDYIPVVAGQTYTLSGTFGYSWLSFFSSNSTITPISHERPLVFPHTFTVPVGANFIIANLYQPSNQNYSNVQLELGNVATAYESGTPSIKLKKEAIYPEVSAGGVGGIGATASVVGDDLTIKAKTVEQTVKLKRAFSLTQSQVFNFIEAKIGGVTIATMSDDVAPLYIADAQISANHGYMGGSITLAAHGKTVADIGSLWTDAAGRECIILDIPDANTIVMTQTITNTSFSASNLVFTHKSGATNTATINATSTASVQVYPVLNKHKTSLSADGIPLDYKTQEVSYKQDFTVSESYGLLLKSDIVAYVIANKGKKITSYESITPFLQFNNSYAFDSDGGCTITSDFVVLKATSFRDFMMLQSVKIAGSGLTYYVPKSLPFSQDSISYDFTKGVDIALTQKPTVAIDFTPDKVDQTVNPVDRYIQRSSVGGFSLGLLPALDAEPTRRKVLTTTKAGRVNTTLKIYHSLVDTTSISNLAVGDYFGGKGYRKYFPAPDVSKISSYAVYDKDADYYFIDYKPSVSKVDIIDLPPRLQNREFTVHEKTNNVSVISKATTSQIYLNVVNSPNAGYIVLKFK